MSTLKIANGIHWCHFHPHISHKAAKSMAKLIKSHMVNYSQLSACQGEMEPSEDNLSTHGCLTSLRYKPQQKQPGQISVRIPA